MAQLQASTVAGTLTTTGNVGIGTASPNSYNGYTTLTLNGSTGGVVDFESGGSRIATINNPGSGLDIYTMVSAPIVFGTNITARMTITGGGNVGIGTNNPVYPVVIWNRGPSGQEQRSLAIGNTNTNGTFMFLGTSATTGGYGVIQHISSEGVSYGNLILQPDGAVVGIGTISPSYALDVYNTGAGTARIRITGTSNYSLFQSDNSSGNFYLGIDNSAGNGFGQGAYSRVLFSSGAYPLVISTNSAERMRITSDGNVGIGTNDPGTYKLNVNGWLGAERIYPYNSNSTYLYGDTGGVSVGGTGYFYSNGSAGSYFQNAVRFRSTISDDANAYLTINGGTSGFTYFGGNVGIGTINPQNKLHIWNGTIEVTGFQSAGSPLTFLESNYNSVDAVKIRFLNYNPSNGLDSDLGIQVMNTGGSMVEVITAKGSNSRVGINTSIPENTLHVYKGSAGTVTANSNSPIVIENSTNAYLNILVPDANESGILFGRPTSDVDGGIIYNSNISRGLEFRTAGNDFKMGITSTGNVGIGTTNPPTKLYVAGNGEFTDTLFISKGASDAIQQGSSVYLVGGSGASYTQLQQGVGRFIIFGFNGSSWIERFTINNTSGNVGIGTAAPRKELDVQGNNLCVVAGQLILGEDAFSTSTSYIGLKTSFQSGTTDYMILSGKSDGATYVSAKAGSSVYIRSGGNTSTAQIEVTDTYARTYSNLGVGTAPSQALDVAGNIRSSNVIYWNGIIGALSWDTGLVTMETNSATAIVLKTNSAERLRIASNGSVGIGISSPSAKLEIVGDVFIPSTNPLYMGGTAGSLSSWGSRQITNSGIHTLSAGAFSVDNSGYVSPVTSSLYVDTLKGNVGIRTTTPAWPLDVVGNARIGANTAQQAHAALQVSAGEGSVTTYRDIDLKGNWAGGEGHAITAMYSTGVNNIVGQIVFEHNSPGSRIKFGRLYDSGDQSTYPMNLVSNGSNGNLGINTTAPAADLHIDSGATGATAYPFRTDAASLDYALYVSSSGNVAVGGLVPASQLNHKLVVFSGSIALRGPNDPNFSYRLNDTGGTNRNALYVSSSNYLNVGNAAFAGLQLFHTGSFSTTYVPEGRFGVEEILGNNADQIALGSPNNWLAVRINTTNYLIPMY